MTCLRVVVSGAGACARRDRSDVDRGESSRRL